MKKYLDCDGVFDVLTRGPFPTGEPIDRDVERHLSCCHECRALAEALRPAVELFHEAIEPEESRDLPGYHGSLAPARGGLAQMVAAAIAAETPASQPYTAELATRRDSEGLFAQRVTRFVAAMAGGALLVLAILSFGMFDGPRSTARSVAITPNEAGLVQLASLNLNAKCFSWTTAAGTDSLHCCTECHRANSPSRPLLNIESVALVTANCRACHPLLSAEY